MNAFVAEIADSCKRSSHMKEALRSSWVARNPTYHVPDTLGNTALHAAAALGEHKVVSALGHLLASRVADGVNAKNLEGDTALHLAALHNQAACVEALLKHDADPAVKNLLKCV